MLVLVVYYEKPWVSVNPPLLAHVAATRMVIIFLKGKGGKEAAYTEGSLI